MFVLFFRLGRRTVQIPCKTLICFMRLLLAKLWHFRDPPLIPLASEAAAVAAIRTVLYNKEGRKELPNTQEDGEKRRIHFPPPLRTLLLIHPHFLRYTLHGRWGGGGEKPNFQQHTHNAHFPLRMCIGKKGRGDGLT